MTPDRRTFLKQSGAALSAAAVGAGLPSRVDGGLGGTDSASEPTARRLDTELLRAVAEVVLPSEVGEAGRVEAVASFAAWADAYEPVAELNHGYGTSEIRYGPPDPVPAWTAQLEALELEARQRAGSSFAALDLARRRDLIASQDLDGGSSLPSPLRARHVAVALMAHWFASPEAVDRCYGRRIAERACRGIDSAPDEPRTL